MSATSKGVVADEYADKGQGGNKDEEQGPVGGLFRVHACWVKAGHDLLHERRPFLLSLLYKVSTEA